MIWFVLVLLIAVLVVAALWPTHQERQRTLIGSAERRGVPGEFVKLSRGVVRYEWHGPSRGPVIVAIHGLTTPPAVFAPLIPGLNELGYRVVTYDLWGRGYSDTPPGPQDAAYYRSQLTELLDHLELQEDITLLGYSMGGAIAVDFAAHMSERLSRLILVAPAGLQLDETRFDAFCRQTRVLGDWTHLAFAARLMAADIAIDRAGHGNDAIAEAQLQGLSRQGYLPSVLASRRGILSDFQRDEHELIGRADIPVIAVWGEQDKVIPLSALGLLAQWNRNAKQEVIDGAGHGVIFTHAKEVATALQGILRERAP